MIPHEQFYKKYRKPQPGRTLIVGSHVYPGREDRRKLYSAAVGVDMLEGPGVDFELDIEDRAATESFLSFATGGFHHVECRSVLEHSKRPWLLAQNLETLMTPGATLDLSVPFVWRTHAYPSDYWRFTTEAIREIFPRVEWKALAYATQDVLATKGKLPAFSPGGKVYLPRCEVLGWGVRK